MITKESSINGITEVVKGFSEALIGSKKLEVPLGYKYFKRKKALKAYNKLVEEGIDVHRARIKTPESIKGRTDEIDDLIGVQTYSKNPDVDLPKIVTSLENSGAGKITVHKVFRKGKYHGVNIKTKINNIPTEVQLSPGRLSNAGQIIEHNNYKPQAVFSKLDKTVFDTIGKTLVRNGKGAWNF